MSEDTFNKFIKPLADKWADDIVKDGLVNEDGTIPMSEWKNMSEEARTYNYDKDASYVSTGQPISFHDTTSHYISFHNKENKELGKLDFNGDKLVFEGKVEESAEKFIEFLLYNFNDKIDKIKEKSYDEGYSDGWGNGYIEGDDEWC